jgi:hypothetical protein
VKYLRVRAERHEKSVETRTRSESDPIASTVERLPSKRGDQPHAFRYFSHKALESIDAAQDASRTKNVVFSAIVLSQFCQELAAIALQHSVVVPRCVLDLSNT